MDRIARIEAAIANLDALPPPATNVAAPACKECVHFVPASRDRLPRGPYCGHLACSHHHFNPVTGELNHRPNVLTRHARETDGLCGPGGLLFASRQSRDPGLAGLARHWMKTTYFLALVGLSAVWAALQSLLDLT